MTAVATHLRAMVAAFGCKQCAALLAAGAHKPPVDKVPKRQCVGCKRRLKPRYATRWDAHSEDGNRHGAFVYTGEVEGVGVASCADLFCSGTCAQRFAVAVARRLLAKQPA